MKPFVTISIIVLGLVLGCASTKPLSQNTDLMEAIKAVRGCWLVHLGRWSSEKSKPWVSSSIYVTPPSRIELTDQQIDQYWKMIPQPGANSVHGFFSRYRAISSDSILLVWSTGQSGLTASVAIRGDSLVGEAESFWDYTESNETAHITLVRSPCE